MLLKPDYLTGHFDERMLRTHSKWLKFDGGDCMMYINCLTKSIASVQPMDFEEKEEEVKSECRC